MSRYIDADKLIENLKDLPEQERIELMNIYGVISKQPTADVQEVRHGKWIDEVVEQDKHPSFAGFYCSCCEHYGIIKYNFCPNCGAKMDGNDITNSTYNCEICKNLCCDRCGKEIKNPNSCYMPTYAIKDYCGKINFSNVGQPRTNFQSIDLCADCCEKFINFLEGDN